MRPAGERWPRAHLTDEAEQDLADIWAYIAVDSERVADLLLRKLPRPVLVGESGLTSGGNARAVSPNPASLCLHFLHLGAPVVKLIV